MYATVLLAAPFLVAHLDGTTDPEAAKFAPPVQLTAGGKNHTGILYPSPALYDVDGDGARELLIGEIFGRHWLDVARYGESSGKESNVVYPHAWRYRDFVIDAMNVEPCSATFGSM